MHIRISLSAIAVASALIAGCSGGSSVPTAQPAAALRNEAGGVVQPYAGVVAGPRGTALDPAAALAWPNYGMNRSDSGGWQWSGVLWMH
jgi:hypothetical protein